MRSRTTCVGQRAHDRVRDRIVLARWRVVAGRLQMRAERSLRQRRVQVALAEVRAGRLERSFAQFARLGEAFDRLEHRGALIVGTDARQAVFPKGFHCDVRGRLGESDGILGAATAGSDLGQQ